MIGCHDSADLIPWAVGHVTMIVVMTLLTLFKGL
jgi:hypothetical protein